MKTANTIAVPNQPRKKVVIIDCSSTFMRSLIDAVNTNGADAIVMPYTTPIEEIGVVNPDAILISGSGWSVNHKKAPKPDVRIFEQANIPVLGICYGLQYMMHALGGTVKAGYHKEQGVTEIYFKVKMDKEASKLLPADLLPTINTDHKSPLYTSFHAGARVWMSHVCQVTKLANGFITTAVSEHLTVASVERNNLFGVHYHPEKQQEPGKDIGNGDLVLESFMSII
jgi:GMP synthase (glutamine-hydrolysing)